MQALSAMSADAGQYTCTGEKEARTASGSSGRAAVLHRGKLRAALSADADTEAI